MSKQGLSITNHRKFMEPPFLNLKGLNLFGHNISSKATFPLEMHSHTECMEFVLLLKGEEYYCTEEQNYNLSRGDMFVSFANQPHKSGLPFQGINEFYWFQLNLTEQKDFLGLSDGNAIKLIEMLNNIKEHKFKASKEALSLVKKSFNAFLNQSSPLFASTLFTHLVVTLLIDSNQQNNSDNKFKMICEYIDCNLENFITLEELSKISSLSLSTIKHKFKEYTGKTPRDYINYKKITKSKELLSSGISVTDVAMSLGFNTSDYFSTVFRRYMAQSPTEYTTKSIMK